MMYFDSNLATVNYIPEKRTVEVIWKGEFVKSEDYRMTLQKALELLVKHKAECWLSDMTMQKAVSQEDKKWVDEHVIPLAIKNGVKKAAFVVPQNIFAKLYADQLAKSIKNSGFEFQYFENRKSAYTWFSN